MPINVDLSETQNPDKVGEFVRVAPGPCHLMVLEAKENGGKHGEHVIKCEVLMHSDPTQVGLVHIENFPADAAMAWKLLGFCYATKIADRNEMKSRKDQGLDVVPIELQDAVGRQFFATISVTEKNSNKPGGGTVAFHNLEKMLAIDNPDAKNFPRNVGMLADAMKGLPTTPAGNAGTTQQPTQSAAPAANPFAALT